MAEQYLQDILLLRRRTTGGALQLFSEKSQKTPTKEINKALKLKAEYEERKKHGDL